MITSFSRGHLIKYEPFLLQWIYSDTGEIYNKDNERHCIRCGQKPTVEGYDSCIGYLKGYSSACCGHGVKTSIEKKD